MESECNLEILGGKNFNIFLDSIIWDIDQGYNLVEKEVLCNYELK